MESGAGEDAEMGKQPGRKDKRGRKKRRKGKERETTA